MREGSYALDKMNEPLTPVSNSISNSAEGRIPFRFAWREFSGSLGDLGLFLPLVVAVSIACELDLALVLIAAGLMNVWTGFMFRQPIPVQPMKALAAVAITGELARGELIAAGLIMGLAMLLFSGVIERVNRIVPKSIVRGIQLGVGIKLALKGATSVLALDLMGPNSIAMGAAALAVLVLTLRFGIPALLFVFLFGFVLIAQIDPSAYEGALFSLPRFRLHLPAMSDVPGGLLKGALPQLPLTTLNSVIAVCALSADYFPKRGIAPKAMARSVGIMNLICVPIGGIAMCHGSGGLAAQYRFGARTGGSVLMLGGLKIAVGLCFGGILVNVLGSYPSAILGPMLFLAGIELGRASRDLLETPGPLFIAIATALGILLTNTWIGFVIGCGLAALLSMLARASAPKTDS